METSVTILSPVDGYGSGKRVVYFLPGEQDNASSVIRNSLIEKMARSYDCTLIIPDGQKSFYTDMENGMPYYTYVANELPTILKKMFGISLRRQLTYVMGISMGGYGALKMAFSRPQNYCKAVSISGIPNIRKHLREQKKVSVSRVRELRGVFGESLELNPKEDLQALVQRQRFTANPVPVLTLCGKEDPFYDMNQEFYGMMEMNKFPIQNVSGEGGHNWEYWNRMLPIAFSYLFEEGFKSECV